MRWPALLEQAVASTSRFTHVTILRVTESTQDAARRQSAGPGEVVVAGRQTLGRGRLGRTWSDTADAGVACTFVVVMECVERLAAAAAVASARALEVFTNEPVLLKWPNDLYIRSRKLGGILIEQSGGVALVGIGVNVAQTAFDAAIAHRAISLNMLGLKAQRIEVMCALIRTLDAALAESDDGLAEAFEQRNLLKGRTIVVSASGSEIRGKVVKLDPIRGLELATAEGRRLIPGAAATIVHDGGVTGA